MNKLGESDTLKILIAGNKRFASGNPIHPHQSKKHRITVAKDQRPIAVIVTCSDSRVSPEIIFDQGLGDLFVICTASNVVDDIGIGSIEYAVKHLGTKVIIVMGHEKCGAVVATINGEEELGYISSITNAIKPVVQNVKNQPGNLLENAVKANVDTIVERLKSTKPILSKLVIEDKLKIVGAVYNLNSGMVKFL